MKKRSLYIFNPEHDLALANGEWSYIPPASVRQLAKDLALLPVWYAEPEDAVWSPLDDAMGFLNALKNRLSICSHVITTPEVVVGKVLEVSPWGWNPALIKRLLLLGVDEGSLPNSSYLESLRDCSHRARVVELLPELRLNDYFCGESFYLRTVEECRAFVESKEEVLLKAPLSGSGKGLNWCRGEFTSLISGWCTRVIDSQEGVVGELIYDKWIDFAMEFYADGEGAVAFVGYSLFRTSVSGKYEGSYLLSDERILNKLSTYVSQSELLKLEERLKKELSMLIGGSYKGYLGVDMMICRFSNSEVMYKIHPCVEINLRMNMGVLAHSITERYLSNGVEGMFQTCYYSVEGQALEAHCKMKASFPLCIEDGRILSGYLSLVPVASHSHYRAWVLVRARMN